MIRSAILFVALAGGLDAQCICPIKLPVEVVGLDGTSVSVPFDIPSSTDVSQPAALYLQIHNLKYQTEASIRLNSSPWIPINDSTATLQGLATAYGGIGGGFTTLKLTVELPGGSLRPGLDNVLTLRFNGTDGRTSGFRILDFNIQIAGVNLIDASRFTADDPATWQPPSNSPVDIAAGKLLWQTAILKTSMTGPAPNIKAHCMDCHAQDGRDLKYFNYSNQSIRARSMFHGLSPAQGDQIASYIRSLTTPAPGRPWNPPYQPGPGLDAAPVEQWSAGAGLDAVLDSNATMLAKMFPAGIPSNYFSPFGNINTHESAIAFPLPDWNAWLPQIHPMDAWKDFATNGFNTRYSTIRGLLKPNDPAAYSGTLGQFATWGASQLQFMAPKITQPAPWTADYVSRVYSTLQWALVKNWELAQEFGLEAMGRVPFPNPRDDPRAWYSGIPFQTSPNMLHIPSIEPTGLNNGKLSTRIYLAFAWYQVQFILNHNNQRANSPIDYGYVYQFVKEMSAQCSKPQSALLSLWLGKGIQLDNRAGPDQIGIGWNWIEADISRDVSPGYKQIWTATPAATRTALMTGMAQGWLDGVKVFTPQQFWDGGIDKTRKPVHGQPDSANFEDRVWYKIPQFRYFGVDQNLINQLAAWAQTVWTSTDWSPTTTAVCLPDTSVPPVVRCSTEK